MCKNVGSTYEKYRVTSFYFYVNLRANNLYVVNIFCVD